jgi:hypothetical protein
MKKTLALTILGLAAGVTASYGQGYVYFSNYFSSTSPTINFAASVTPGAKDNLALGANFYAELSWYNGVTANALSLQALPSTIVAFGFSPTTADGETGSIDPNGGAGWFLGTPATLTGYTAGLVTLEVTVFGTEGGNSYAGQSALFTMTPATGTEPIPGFNQLQVVANSIQYNPGSYSVVNVPEPTTMALGALGGLGLLLFRRKQV